VSLALLIILLTAAGALLLGLAARRGHDMNLEQWSVGGRSFGTLFVFLLLAGEIYTIFSFLGASGFIYGKGAAAYYILAYLTLNQVIGYWLLPQVWRTANRNHLVSQPQFLVHQYGSKALGVLVAMVGVAAMIPYLVLQFTGLGIIVSIASNDAISRTEAVWMGATIVTTYVMISGMRGAAWNAVIKDMLILGIVVFLGIYLPLHYYGGIGSMFRAIDHAMPGFLAFPTRGNSVVWFQSTVLLNAMGGFMYPHVFSSIFTARGDRILRRNTVVMPLYSLMLLFAFFAGFAAILQVPGLTGASIDLALIKLCTQTFPPWFVGIVGATGLLTALVPGSVLLTAASTMLANDLYRAGMRPAVSNASVTRLAKALVPAVAAVAVFFTLRGGATIVALLLMGYNLVTQFFPAVAFSFARRNPVTSQGAFCGILAGTMCVVAMTLTKATLSDLLPFLPVALRDLNIGLAALILNLSVTAFVSALTRQTVVPQQA
jgi:SSS family solute:Na+ symporter